jgi:hypothetical protein
VSTSVSLHSCESPKCSTRDSAVRFPCGKHRAGAGAGAGVGAAALGRVESDSLRHVPIAHMRAAGRRVMQAISLSRAVGARSY